MLPKNPWEVREIARCEARGNEITNPFMSKHVLESYVYLAYIFETVQKVIVSQNLDQELLLMLYFL